MTGRIAHGVTVDARTVRLGDQLLIAGQAFTITDMTALPHGARRLRFATGETFTMLPATVLYATRLVAAPARRRQGQLPTPSWDMRAGG